MVMPNKSHRDEKNQKIIEEAKVTLAGVSAECLAKAIVFGLCPCLICQTAKELETNQAVMVCAGIAALDGRPEMLQEINDFIDKLIEKYPNAKPAEPSGDKP